MSRKKHIYPNGTHIEVLFEGTVVGTGKIVEHLLEQDDMYPTRENLFYRVDIEQTELDRLSGRDKEHWLNDFEVRPIK